MRLRRREEQDDGSVRVRTGPRSVGAPPRPVFPDKTPAEPGLSRGTLWWILAAGVLVLLTVVAQHFDEYLRRTLESKINQRLHGYTVTLEGAHLSPFNLSLTLQGAVIRQQAHP